VTGNGVRPLFFGGAGVGALLSGDGCGVNTCDIGVVFTGC